MSLDEIQQCKAFSEGLNKSSGESDDIWEKWAASSKKTTTKTTAMTTAKTMPWDEP